MFSDRHRAHGRRRRVSLILAAPLVVLAAVATSSMGPNPASVFAVPSPGVDPTTRIALPTASFTVSPLSQTRQWLAAHQHDPRAVTLGAALGNQPDALWLTGGERDLPNLADLLAQASRTSTTPVIALYNIPGRDDGLTGPTARIDATGYQRWVDAIAARIGSANAIVVVEPDALWLADRQFRDTRSGLHQRLTLLRYAATRLNRNARTHVYLDAGTSSGSVTPARMADLLAASGVSARTGFAVNVSSFAPHAAITTYAQQIRTALRGHGVDDPRYVIDTSRNGNPRWDNDTWCNPPDRKVGAPPSAHPTPSSPGLDANLWVKAPGTSDGSCGTGIGSSGGDFLPDVALSMIR